MNYRYTGILAALLCFAALALPATTLAQGEAGAAVLQIPQGPQAEGMGRFFTSVAEGPFTAWWNPAGLANMHGWNAALMHTKLVPGLADDVYFDHLGGNWYLEGWGGVHASFTYLNYGTTDATNTGGDDQGDFSAYEWALSGAIGTEIMNNLSVGAGVKVAHVNLVNGLNPENNLSGGGVGTAFGADVGLLYHKYWDKEDIYGQGPGHWRFGFGAAATNLGPDIQLNEDRQGDDLPRQLKLASHVKVEVPESFSFMVGGGMDKSLISQEITDEARENNDITWLDEQDILLHGGLEVGIAGTAFGRFGYLYDDPGEIKDVTYGFGFIFNTWLLDVASIPQSSDLDRVWKFSIGYQSQF